MIARVFIAVVGAIVVTGCLLLAMESLTTLFENERGERYFRITDILPKPDPGRPERPQAARRPPNQPAPEVLTPDAAVPIEAPGAIELEAPPVATPGIELPELPDN
jgi:hypothetical protein